MPRDAGPEDAVSAMDREFPYEFALCATIALTKGVDRVYFTEVVTSPFSKGAPIESRKIPLYRKRLEDRVKRRLKKPGQSKKLAILGYVHRAKLARPGKHVLKNESVNGLKVCDIEPAIHGTLFELNEAR